MLFSAPRGLAHTGTRSSAASARVRPGAPLRVARPGRAASGSGNGTASTAPGNGDRAQTAASAPALAPQPASANAKQQSPLATPDVPESLNLAFESIEKNSKAIKTTGLRRAPLSGGVKNATQRFDLPTPCVAVRNLVEQAQFAHLCTVMSHMHHRCDVNECTGQSY